MIHSLLQFYEDHKREIILGILFFLISTLSFGLGYLVAQEGNRAPIVIEKNS
jgi:hypothetical protein